MNILDILKDKLTAAFPDQSPLFIATDDGELTLKTKVVSAQYVAELRSENDELSASLQRQAETINKYQEKVEDLVNWRERTRELANVG